MAFTLETWKTGLKERLPGWQERMGQAGVGSIYAFLSAAAVLPVVEAMQQGDWAAMSALGGVVAGLGSNLLATTIQNWKDEADGARQLASQIENDTDLRAEIDAVLEELHTLDEARTTLPDTERQWFAETLKNELAQLGNLARFEVTLYGGDFAAGDIKKGGVHIDKSQVDGPVVGGDVGELVMGDKIQAQTYIAEQSIIGESGPDKEALQNDYLNHILHKANILPLAGIDPKAASSESESRLHLSAVYTALMTKGGEIHEGKTMPMGRKQERQSALSQLDRHNKLVLLGDPGSGKSTFANFVTVCLAGTGLKREDINLELLTAPLPDEEGKPQEEPQPWRHGFLLPVHVVLRDFAARGLSEKGRNSAQDLWLFIESELTVAGLGEYAPCLKKHLHREGGLLLLDGLDEVPATDNLRDQIKNVVDDFSNSFPKVRILVTSRIYAYQKQSWQLPDFEVAILDDFNPGQIRYFIDGWYEYTARTRNLNPDIALGQAESLKKEIFKNPRLMELAVRPLLLTLMASLHSWRGGTLPEKREELYHDAVDLLLDRWEEPKVMRDAQGDIVETEPSLAEWLQVDRDKVRELLNQLAFEAHAEQEKLEGTADIPESKLVSGLLDLSHNPDIRPKLLMAYLSNRAGLLVPRGVKVYTFPHRTFQEYLAACHLTDDDFPEKLAEMAREYPDRWREVTLLAGAKAARGSKGNIWQLAEALCYKEPYDDLRAVWGAHLAGQALVETADLQKIAPRNISKIERLQRWLPYIMRQEILPAVERAAASANLADLGDTRSEVTTVDAMQFCFVPRGPFLMGSNDVPKDDDEFWQTIYDSQKPLHEVDVHYDYWLARYPVTNAQFRQFVNADGYEKVDYWAEALEAGIWKDGQVTAYTWLTEKSKYERVTRNGAYDYGRPFNLENHPVVGVTWYEALAFCRWLTDKWKTAGLLPDGWAIHLPSEVEWEKAARGGLQYGVESLVGPLDGDLPQSYQLIDNPLPERLYPWGDEDAVGECANGRETDISASSGVGAFAAGMSPYGCEEMSGNVFEWTRSLWGEGADPTFSYPYENIVERENLDKGVNWPRVLRGGSWAVGEHWLRCASRIRSCPDYGTSATVFGCVRPQFPYLPLGTETSGL